MARADVHIFGSVSGYGTTAASAGVTESEKRELGSFQFGEAATADAIARLEHHAVMTGRPLASGRFAISRMLPAGVDDAGRPTIEVISLLLSASGYESCAGSMQMLASDVGLWRRARTEVSAGIEIPAANSAGDPEDLASLRAFDLWIAATRSGGVGVMSESESPTVLAMVCTLHQRDRAQCRWGVGMLSISAPVDIASLASGTSTLGARAVIRAAKNGAWHCEETECAQVLATSGGKAFAALEELVEHVRPHLPELQDSRRYAHETGPSSSTREHRVTLAAIGSAVLSSLALALGLIVWTSSGRPPGGDVPPSAPSAPSDDVSDDGTASARDSGSAYGAVGPTPVAAVDPPKSGENATVEQSQTPPEGTETPPTPAEVSAAPLPAPPTVKILELVMVTWYADDDGDNAGDPAVTHLFPESGATTPGWVPNADDECPEEKLMKVRGECDCDFKRDQALKAAVKVLDGIQTELSQLSADIWKIKPPMPQDLKKSVLADPLDFVRYLDDLRHLYRRLAKACQVFFDLDEKLRGTKVDSNSETPLEACFMQSPKGAVKQNYRSLNDAWLAILQTIPEVTEAFEAELQRFEVARERSCPVGVPVNEGKWHTWCADRFASARLLGEDDESKKLSETLNTVLLKPDWILKQKVDLDARMQSVKPLAPDS